MRRTLGLVAIAAIGACLTPGTSSAATVALGARPSALHPLGGCSVTVSPFTFSTFSPLTRTGRFTQGYVRFNCGSGIASIALSTGESGTFRTRRMTAGNDVRAVLLYNIFLDAGHTRIFGDGTAGSTAYVPGPNVSQGGFPIYGEIAAGQTNLRVASYADSISITVNVAP